MSREISDSKFTSNQVFEVMAYQSNPFATIRTRALGDDDSQLVASGKATLLSSNGHVSCMFDDIFFKGTLANPEDTLLWTIPTGTQFEVVDASDVKLTVRQGTYASESTDPKNLYRYGLDELCQNFYGGEHAADCDTKTFTGTLRALRIRIKDPSRGHSDAGLICISRGDNSEFTADEVYDALRSLGSFKKN